MTFWGKTSHMAWLKSLHFWSAASYGFFQTLLTMFGYLMTGQKIYVALPVSRLFLPSVCFAHCGQINSFENIACRLSLPYSEREQFSFPFLIKSRLFSRALETLHNKDPPTLSFKPIFRTPNRHLSLFPSQPQIMFLCFPFLLRFTCAWIPSASFCLIHTLHYQGGTVPPTHWRIPGIRNSEIQKTKVKGMPGMFLGRGTWVPSIKGMNGLAIKPEPGKALAPLMPCRPK